jgi:hypothetical protein
MTNTKYPGRLRAGAAVALTAGTALEFRLAKPLVVQIVV